MAALLDQPGTDTTIDIDTAFADIIANEEVVEDDGMGNAERFSHYVNKEAIVQSSITGKPATAVCGKKWTPSKSPEGLPICPKCKELYELMKKE